jgi:hypothetical protein
MVCIISFAGSLSLRKKGGVFPSSLTSDFLLLFSFVSGEKKTNPFVEFSGKNKIEFLSIHSAR